jgi:hypothetical protein
MGGYEMEKKRVYEKPALRKVRLDVKTAVLAVCNISATSDPVGGLGCMMTGCFDQPPV